MDMSISLHGWVCVGIAMMRIAFCSTYIMPFATAMFHFFPLGSAVENVLLTKDILGTRFLLVGMKLHARRFI